jgi:predicted nuclease of predicted toxin-antitoxin system
MVANARKSKKRSAASSPSLPDRLVFFTDANLGRRVVPEALRTAGEEVKVHDDCFAAGTQDLVWLREADRNSWVVLTKDSRIRYRRNEMEALLSSGARSFVLVSRNLPGKEMAKIFVRALPGMKKLCAALPAPFIAHVHHDGKVVLMKTVRKSG